MGDEIVIDRATLRALGADTRLTILQRLLKRKSTLTELAEGLSMSHSTVKEHLEVLAEGGLVQKLEEGRKWKYYKLTLKGYRIVAPVEVKALFVFAFSGILALGLGLRRTLPLLAGTAARSLSTASGVASGADRSLAMEAVPQIMERKALAAAAPAVQTAQGVGVHPIDIVLVIITAACIASGLLYLHARKRRVAL